LIVGIFVKLKAARSSNPGDKKTAQAGALFSHALPHAPDAESGQYRNESRPRNNIFAGETML
ncbi:MAG TPA: hypothetical protein VEX43_17660, partial [Chthoniobacterales bacterium]|nr:hypothetical protein [Chthoniobacterales bacterium]